ncbi:hypothetical protein TYRP_016247 [Tyrophagus putrescentiae]|nr:hypothetical protein TYRP_016247 [Tyrophagus putrescentiae]
MFNRDKGKGKGIERKEVVRAAQGEWAQGSGVQRQGARARSGKEAGDDGRALAAGPLSDRPGDKPASVRSTRWSVLERPHIHSRTARILLCLVVPCHLVFLLALSLLHHTNTSANSSSSPIPGDHLTHFLLAYLSCCLLQVLLLLYLAELLISWMWSRGIDPDNSAIPYLTALGDLFGTFFLFIAFTSLPR